MLQQIETNNSNLNRSYRLNSTFSNNQKNFESTEPEELRPVFKKFSEDLSDLKQNSLIPQKGRIQSRLNMLQKKKFPTLTPLMTPRIPSAFSTATSSENIKQFTNIPSISSTNFKKLSKLGKGMQAFGCFKCIDLRDKETIVVKEIKNNDEEITAHFKYEFKIINKLDHQNIVKAKELIIEEGFCQLVMEYAEGKQLGHYLKKLTEIQILEIAKQLFSALDYLQDKSIMHRDLHFNNLIYDKTNKKIKVIDFGIAKELKDKLSGASCAGDIEYRAPEMLNYMPYTCKIDIFKTQISPEFQKLIESLLRISSKERLSAKEALSIVNAIQLTVN